MCLDFILFHIQIFPFVSVLVWSEKWVLMESFLIISCVFKMYHKVFSKIYFLSISHDVFHNNMLIHNLNIQLLSDRVVGCHMHGAAILEFFVSLIIVISITLFTL